MSCLSSSPFSSWQQTSPSRVCRAHFAGSGVCTEGPDESMAHTGGLFFMSVPLTAARGSRTEAGASDDIERKGREHQSHTKFKLQPRSTRINRPVSHASEGADVILLPCVSVFRRTHAILQASFELKATRIHSFHPVGVVLTFCISQDQSVH